MDDELREDRLFLKITIDRNPRELVIWLNNNGALVNVVGGTDLMDDEWAERNNSTIDAEYRIILLNEYLKGEVEPEEPYGGGRDYIGASVPVSLLVRLSERPEVVKSNCLSASPTRTKQTCHPRRKSRQIQLRTLRHRVPRVKRYPCMA